MKSRRRHMVGRLAAAIALLATFIVSLLIGVAVHLPLPPSRRIVTKLIAEQASKPMRGSIKVAQVSRLTWRAVELRGVKVLDPDGVVVLASERVRGRINLLALASSILIDKGPVRIRVSWVRADHVDMVLRNDATGQLSLATTFLAPVPLVAPPPGPPKVPGRPVVVELGVIEVGSVAARGSIIGIEALEADARAVRGAVRVAPGDVKVDSQRFPMIFAGALPLPLNANLEFHWHSPALFWTTFSASYAQLMFTGFVRVDGDYIDGRLDIPNAPPDALVGIVPPSVQPREPWDAHIETHGRLPELYTTIRLDMGRAGMIAQGPVTFAPKPLANMNVELRNFDPSMVLREAPVMEIDADLRVRALQGEDGKPRLEARGRTTPTSVEGVAIPAADLDVTVAPPVVRGTARLHEPGMPIDAEFVVDDEGRIEVQASSKIPSLMAAPRLQRALSGAAHARLDGRFADGRIEASMTADVQHLGRDQVRLKRGRVTARLWGDPNALSIEAAVQGTDFAAPGFTWESATGSVRGRLRNPHAHIELRDDDAPNVRANAGLSFDPRFVARNVELEVSQHGETITGNTDVIDMRGDVVDFGMVAIDGLGGPVDAAVRVGPRGFDVRLISEALEIERVTRVLGLPRRKYAGTADVDIDVKSIDGDSTGCARIDLRDARVDLVDHVDLSLRAAFEGKRVELSTNLSIGSQAPVLQVAAPRGRCLPALPVRSEGIILTSALADLILQGPPTEASSWTNAVGTALLTNLHVNLDRVGQTVSMLRMVMPGLQVPQVGGHIYANGEVVRLEPGLAPSWKLVATTSDARVDLGSRENPRLISGANVKVFGSMSSAGQFVASMCLRNDTHTSGDDACDPNNVHVLASFSAMAVLDYDSLLKGTRGLRAVAEEAAVDARLVVYERPVKTLLAPFFPEASPPVDATAIGGWVRVHGTYREPLIDYRLHALELGTGNQDWRVPGAICAHGGYDGSKATLYAELMRSRSATSSARSASVACSASGTQSSHEPVGYVSGEVLIDWSKALAAHSPSEIPWEGNANFIMHRLNLADIPFMADHDIAGDARLMGGVRGLGVDPQFGVQLEVNKLQLGAANYDHGSLAVGTDRSGLRGMVSLDSPDAAGKLQTRLHAIVTTEQVRWARGFVPEFDSDKPISVDVTARALNIAVLSPLLRPVFSYVDGQITGFLRATWSPDTNASRIDLLTANLTHGSFQIPLIGQEFLDVAGSVRNLGPDRLLVDNFSAKSFTGAVSAAATINLKGLGIDTVNALFTMDESNKLRLTFEGVPVGDLWGEVVVALKHTDERNDVEVDVSNINIDLSDVDLRAVQSLAPNEDVEVVPSMESILKSGRRVIVPGEWGLAIAAAQDTQQTPPTPWRLRVRTKNPAFVQRTGMRFWVTTPDPEKDPEGVPTLLIPDPVTNELKLTGYLILSDGRVDVMGKRFDLEPGRARLVFDGDPGNPLLNVTARWEAPDGTRVSVDVTGPLKDPRIQFRSEPPRPQAEIISLVLFGRQPGQTDTPAGEGSAAAGVGGGVAAAGLNRVLEDLSPVAVSTRVDTGESQNVRPTIVVEVAPSVTAEATIVTGEVHQGQNPDRYLLTLDWRFRRKWSLRTTMGDKGSSIFDVIWQHRY